MRKKLIFLALTLVIVLAGSLGYLFFVSKQGSPALDPQDVKTCQTDADCGWYQSLGNEGASVVCGNLNVVKNQDDASAGNPPKDSICVCTNNACQSATFTLPNNSPVQK